MNAATLSATTTLTASEQRDRLARPPRRPARVRPAGRSGRRAAPPSRPARPLAAPSLSAAVQAGVSACCGEPVLPVVVTAVSPRIRIRTRLTDRGIAVILVAGAMIVLAAVTVVGLTALRVTSDSYQPLPPAFAAQP